MSRRLAKMIGWIALFTLFASQTCPKHFVSSRFTCHPLAAYQWRIMTDVLEVATRKSGDPVVFVVDVITFDRLIKHFESRGRT